MEKMPVTSLDTVISSTSLDDACPAPNKPVTVRRSRKSFQLDIITGCQTPPPSVPAQIDAGMPCVQIDAGTTCTQVDAETPKEKSAVKVPRTKNEAVEILTVPAIEQQTTPTVKRPLDSCDDNVGDGTPGWSKRTRPCDKSACVRTGMKPQCFAKATER